MSAFEVSDGHIDVLIAAACGRQPRSDVSFTWRHDGEWRKVTPETAGAVGDMLTRMNYAAVDYRYRSEGDEAAHDYPAGYRPARVLAAHWAQRGHLNPVAVLKAIDCYEYQCDGHPTWDDSEAREFCQRLRHWMIEQLPGYDSAAWAITDISQAAA